MRKFTIVAVRACVVALFLLSFAAVAPPSAYASASASAPSLYRRIDVINDAGVRVDIHWMNPETNETVLQSDPDVSHGATFVLNSFVGHTFEVREVAAKGLEVAGGCGRFGKGNVCGIAQFTVNSNEDQIIFIRDGVTIEHTDGKTVANKSPYELIDDCKASSSRATERSGGGGVVNFSKILEDLSACMRKGIARNIEQVNEEISFNADVREKMANLFENYTCADEKLDTAEALQTTIWRGRTVDILIDRPASKIHTVQNFVTENECDAVEDAAKPRLGHATVADGSGETILSDARKAMQANLKVTWERESDGDSIARLSRRVYDYVNHVLPFDIHHDGQEDLFSIQYFGRGPDDEDPDQYMPHCDGDCSGLDFKPGNRMATMVVYCDIPVVGGATNFRNSGIHIVPKKYSATFFSYIDPATMKMDAGFTEHSGCPVIKGEKKIVTQWVRLGVNDAIPWSAFNTLGVKHSDAANQ